MQTSFLDTLLGAKILPLPVKYIGNADVEVIAETICALLNGQGGWIVVGIDDECDYVGLDYNKTKVEVQRELTNNIAPLPLVYLQEDTYKGNDVMLITVLKGSLPPYSYKGKYFIINGTDVLMPSPDQISVLMRNSFSIKSTWEVVVNLLATPNSLNTKLMDEVYQTGLASHRLAESPGGLSSTLSELQLIDSYEIKNGAVCLFGDNTNKTLPQSRVRIQLMTKGKTANSFDNTLILEGNILFLLKEVMDYFSQILPRQSIFIENSLMRVDEYLYPMDVLREAIGNSLIHRDYSGSVGEIGIFIFQDRIEITNPGSLPEDVIKGKREVIPHRSFLRNPLMAEIFYIAGYMEKTGRGMDLISQKMKQLGKKLPEWTSSNNSTTLKIFNKTANINYNERIEHFLQQRSLDDIFTKNEYMDSFDKKPSKITAQNDISVMLELGICKKIGNGPATKYKIINRL